MGKALIVKNGAALNMNSMKMEIKNSNYHLIYH